MIQIYYVYLKKVQKLDAFHLPLDKCQYKNVDQGPAVNKMSPSQGVQGCVFECIFCFLLQFYY